jgi:hypothetical protein
MDNKLLLTKGITLLFRESQLSDKNDMSHDLVRTVVEDVKLPEVGVGLNTDREVLIGLKNTLMEMCDNPPDTEYDIPTLLQQLKVNCGEDDTLYDTISEAINAKMEEPGLKRSVVSLRRGINRHFREEQIAAVLNKVAYTFTRKRETIKDINQFIAETIGQLEPLQLDTDEKDPAVMGEIDLGDDGSVQAVFKEIRKKDNGESILKTGWRDLNDMLQGGFRRGEFWIVPGLQHKYKTGTNLALFKQFAQHNTPYLYDKTKKPLLLRISFEDDLALNLQFLYQSLKQDEGILDVDFKETSEEEMAKYIQERLQINGFRIKMMRVDPTQWSYRNICNKIISLEAQGYEIAALLLDYLGLVPTTGCNTTGPMGTDMRDLFRRIRNFCGPKKITVVTPHQLSTEAKGLIRGGIPEDQFVKEIAEKGYYSGCKQLDQEVDGEIYIHLFKHNKETYLAFQRGKHRLPSIVPDSYKYFLKKFPKGRPIPDDINDENHVAMRKLPNAASNAESELFF